MIPRELATCLSPKHEMYCYSDPLFLLLSGSKGTGSFKWMLIVPYNITMANVLSVVEVQSLPLASSNDSLCCFYLFTWCLSSILTLLLLFHSFSLSVFRTCWRILPLAMWTGCPYNWLWLSWRPSLRNSMSRKGWLIRSQRRSSWLAVSVTALSARWENTHIRTVPQRL